MKRRKKIKEILQILRNEKIATWFDMGIFIDKLRDNRDIPSALFSGSYGEYSDYIKKGGIAFLTFHYSIDGVTVEVEKYAKIYRKNYPGIPIYYISGEFYPESDKLIDPTVIKYRVEEMKGFNDWKLYKDFFFTKIERGSKAYNKLILDFWEEALQLIEKLGDYIEKKNISLLYLINVCSNPGNVSLALAVVLISEYLGIPVINNNHDFYWEGGNKKIDIQEKGLKTGPRDFFFTNSDIGEFFSQIEVLYSWESRSWINVNINRGQSEYLIKMKGHNPANVTEIGTAVDTSVFMNINKRKRIETFFQFEKALSRYKDLLIGYSVDDVITNKLVDPANPKPILIGSKTKPIDKFIAENVIFLQPTRIISRKRIEFGFRLVEKLFRVENFLDKIDETKHLKITILVTGPIAAGHYDYFEVLIKRFAQLLDSLNESFRKKVFLAFLFSELDNETFKSHFAEPAGMPELYNISSLILLPSKTEGRGLPIIEATACGVPIFCRRYYPKQVYSEVIGEHLPEKDRLKVIEFDGKKITSQHVAHIIDRVFFPHKYTEEIKHNKKAVEKRYSLKALNNNMQRIWYNLYLQLASNQLLLAEIKECFKKYKTYFDVDLKKLSNILNQENRQYLPGFGKLSFMLFLKSLIDPSYFRVEEQRMRGMLFDFAKRLITSDPDYSLIPFEKVLKFYNMTDNIFNYKEGKILTSHDHSFAYRHRNKNYFPYQDYTFQELTGMVNLLYLDIIKPEISDKVDESPHFFTDWNLALSQMTSSPNLAIDDRDKLIQKLKANLPIAYFPGKYLKHELDLFALQSARSRLNLRIEEELTEQLLIDYVGFVAPIYIFAQKQPLVPLLDKKGVIDYIEKGNDRELKLLYKYKVLNVVETNQICVGIHFYQLGNEALDVLNKVQHDGGFIISNRMNAAIMTDIVDIDRFHIGKAQNPLVANFMGIPGESGYIQFVPAGVRATLAYPTPVQTAKEFSEILKSTRFKELSKKAGEEEIFDIIRKDAVSNGSPLKFVLENIYNKADKEGDVEYSFVSGVYDDGLPWNGVMAKTGFAGTNKQWEFVVVSSNNKTKKVTEFATESEKNLEKEVKIAWNGGYILNAELVGKLGLQESYIGSPLGLLVSNGKMVCPPLFNKAALLIYENGKIDIKRINLSSGMSVSRKTIEVKFLKNSYNLKNPGNDPCYYDLLFEDEEILGNGRVIVRLAGNVIKEVIHTKRNEKVNIIPVGLTLSFPKEKFPKKWDRIGTELTLLVNGISNVWQAVEAGPLLVYEKKVVIDMELEGWKKKNSIKTQAARLDFEDMRGPKIAAGIDKKGNLLVLTINGRIRESVGATHHDMASIMMKFGAYKAMGFDPGGSSTLVVNGVNLNISPYNKDYEKNVYALHPEPRAVANAVIGYLK